MKIIAIICLSLLSFSLNTHAACIKNNKGDMVCGQGQCEKDQYGKVHCSDAGGGAMKDRHGKVRCGPGYCARDSYGKIWCSEQPGGSAAKDNSGKVVCVGKCVKASTEMCQG